MKVDFHTGEESWLADGYGVPQFTYYGGDDYEIVVKTTRGVVTMMVSPGEPEFEFDVEEFREALNRRLNERKTEREMEDAE